MRLIWALMAVVRASLRDLSADSVESEEDSFSSAAAWEVTPEAMSWRRASRLV